MGFFRTIRITMLPWRGNQGFYLALLGSVAFMVAFFWLTQPPRTLQEAEAHLGEAVLAFMERDGILYAVVRDGGEIRFDHMAEGPLRLAWPPVQFWVLDDPAWSVPLTFDRAVAGRSYQDDTWMIYGQIQDPEIVLLEYRVDDAWYSAPVAAPGFIVVLDDDPGRPDRLR